MCGVNVVKIVVKICKLAAHDKIVVKIVVKICKLAARDKIVVKM